VKKFILWSFVILFIAFVVWQVGVTIAQLLVPHTG